LDPPEVTARSNRPDLKKRKTRSFGNRKGYRIVEIHADNKMSTYQYDAENAKVMNQYTL